MLDYFRKHADSPVVKVFYAAVSLSFIAGFGGLLRNGGGCGGKPTDPGTVATVAGKPIHIREVERTADSIRERLEERMGGNLDPKMLKMFKIQNQAVEQLVNEALMLEASRRAGIVISDDEVVKAIREARYFARDDGTFSAEKYHDVLKSNGISAADFEDDQRRRLAMIRLQDLAASAVIVTDAAAEEQYRLGNERVELSYLSFDPAKLEDGIPEPDPAGLSTFFEAHRDQFQEPAKVRVAFLTVDPKSIEPDVKIDDSDVRARYEKDAKLYDKPESVTARHILIQVKPDASDEEVALAEAKAEDVLARLQAGGDFAAEAKRSSDDPGSKERGGELGAFPRGRMDKAFEKAAFEAEAGKLVGPVRSSFGFHVILVEQHDPARIVPLDEVQDQIRQTLAGEKAQKLAEARANNDRKQLFEKGPDADWKAFADELKLPSGEAGPVAAGEPIDGARQLTDAALALKVGEWSQPVRTGKGFQLVKVLEKQEARPLSLDEARDAAVQAYRKDQARTKARAMAEETRQKLAGGATIDAVGEQSAVPVQSTGPFALTARTIPGLGADPALQSEAQKLGDTNRVASQPLELSGKFVVLAFGKRTEADGGDPAKRKDGVDQARQQLRSEQQQRLLEALVDHLKGTIQVSYNTDLMKSLAEE